MTVSLQHKHNPPSIYIYQGGENQEGVSSDSHGALVQLFKQSTVLKSCSNKKIKPARWSKGSLFILPGGVCSSWEIALGIKRQRKILRWIENGGRILAFCAGSYFCSARSEYRINVLQNLSCQRKIALFPGLCQGPTFSKELKVVKIRWLKSNAEGYVTMIGGGSFIPDGSLSTSSYEPLATYCDEEKATSLAVVKCFRKNGLAVLSAPHLEFNSSHLEAVKLAFPDRTEEIAKMQKQLEESASFRQKCLHDMLNELE